MSHESKWCHRKIIRIVLKWSHQSKEIIKVSTTNQLIKPLMVDESPVGNSNYEWKKSAVLSSTVDLTHLHEEWRAVNEF